MNPKQRAAEAALQYVQSGMVVGLGTGSTADFFLKALADALKAGKLQRIVGVPTSRKSEARSEHLGIPLATLAQCPSPDVCIDGADEVGPRLDLIKGLGGALVRERIVAQNSKKLVIIADAGKVVPVLGSKSPLPVEVVTFGHETHAAFFRGLGAEPTLRTDPDGKPFITDNGCLIYDCRFQKIDDAAGLEMRILRRAGVAGTGLFVQMADVVLIGSEDRLETRTKGA